MPIERSGVRLASAAPTRRAVAPERVAGRAGLTDTGRLERLGRFPHTVALSSLLFLGAMSGCKKAETAAARAGGQHIETMFDGLLQITDSTSVTANPTFDIAIKSGSGVTEQIKGELNLVVGVQKACMVDELGLTTTYTLADLNLSESTSATVEARGYAPDGTITGCDILTVKAEEKLQRDYETYLHAETRGEDLTQTELYKILVVWFGSTETSTEDTAADTGVASYADTTTDLIARSGARTGAEFTQWFYDNYNFEFTSAVDGMVDSLAVPIYTHPKAKVVDPSAAPYVLEVFDEETRVSNDVFVAERQEMMTVEIVGDTGDTGEVSAELIYDVYKVSQEEVADVSGASAYAKDGYVAYVVNGDAEGALEIVRNNGNGSFELSDPLLTIPTDVINPAVDSLVPLNYYAELAETAVYSNDGSALAYNEYTFSGSDSTNPTRYDFDSATQRLEFVRDLSKPEPETVDVIDPFLFSNSLVISKFSGNVSSAYAAATESDGVANFSLNPVSGYETLSIYQPVAGTPSTYLPDTAARFYMGNKGETGYENFHSESGFRLEAGTKVEFSGELNPAAADYVGFVPLQVSLAWNVEE